MDKFLSSTMAPKQPRARADRMGKESKMAAAAGPRAAAGISETSSPAVQGTVDHEGIKESCEVSPAAAQLQSSDASNPASPECPTLMEQPVTYTEVIKAVQTAMTPMLQAHTATLQRAVHELKGELTQLTQAVHTNECRLGEVFQDVSELKRQHDTLQKSYLQLHNKVDDLENRSRRCNLRILGIPETVKGQDLFHFLQNTLPDLLQVKEACANMIVERAHRLGPARADTDNRPRVVIFKSLSYVHKEAIWAASRKQRDIRWNDSRLLIFQDYSAEVTRARKEFAPLCSKLVKTGKKFALLFPARLRLYQGSAFKDFSSVEDAERFLAELQVEERESQSTAGGSCP